jgi:hypothetical protein
MSYQTYQGQTINHFIPNYVVKSDYLPTRVVEGNQGQTAQWVKFVLYYRLDNMKKKKEEEEYTHRDPSNSILADMHHSRFMKLLEPTNLSMNNISVVLYVDDCLIYKIYL